MSKRTVAILLTFMFCLLLLPCTFGRSKHDQLGRYCLVLTDKQKIYLLIDQLRQGVKQQKVEKIAEVMAPDFSSAGKSLDREELRVELQDLFANSHQRREIARFKELRPVGIEVSSTWDFEIKDVEISINGNEATVSCNLVFWAATPDPEDKEYPLGRGVRETISLSKENKVWKISRTEQLLSFLEKYGEIPSDNDHRRESLGEKKGK
jgi:hypothetical protein